MWHWRQEQRKRIGVASLTEIDVGLGLKIEKEVALLNALASRTIFMLFQCFFL